MTAQSRRNHKWTTRFFAFGAVFLMFGAIVIAEMKSSLLQSFILHRYAGGATFQVVNGANEDFDVSAGGPFDYRLGYARIADFTDTLLASGFTISAQARLNPRMRTLSDIGVFLPYKEKPRAGLDVLDGSGRPLFSARSPERIFTSFEQIPPVLLMTVLFIENRELLDLNNPYKNPAIEWDRFALAAFGMAKRMAGAVGKPIGGSTIATQIEKFRHSSDGRTHSAGDKLTQMISAAFRAYKDSARTTDARRNIVLDYINAIPLAAIPGHGEVIGLGDGLAVWYGVELDSAAALLSESALSSDSGMERAAPVLRMALSLFLAHRRPSHYLLSGAASLTALTDQHARLMAAEGIIPEKLAELVVAARPALLTRRAAGASPDFVERKGANATRSFLMAILGVDRLYELDRLDLTVSTTLNGEVQRAVAQRLRSLSDPKEAANLGITGIRVAPGSDPSQVIYSFTLFEQTPSGPVLRIQTDNFAQPLNINDGIKLDLGSTAKLRTLAHYLEIVAELHDSFVRIPVEELSLVRSNPRDRIAQWIITYIHSASDTSLDAVLAAALERRYSASPAERFFTGGMEHRFENFNADQDGQVPTIREAFRQSINLPFIRLMREIVEHHTIRIPEVSEEIFQKSSDTTRRVYLEKFADKEGRIFVDRAFRKFKGKASGEIIDAMILTAGRSLKPAALIHRSLLPEESFEEFRRFLTARFPAVNLSEKSLAKLYNQYDPDSMSLSDRGFLARVHPLELWTAAYLSASPGAVREEAITASSAARQEAYRWLFNSTDKAGQDRRIRVMLEAEAFIAIHRAWQRLRYPFASLVPSYATAIGTSADRPTALAELAGIIQSGGMYAKPRRVSRLHFAERTPYETVFEREADVPRRVMRTEIAAALRGVLDDVVEKGTARRVHGVFRDASGNVISVGGKTGTGDHRYLVFGKDGQVVKEEFMNRSAVFVYALGDRFHGTVTAFVPGKIASRYTFTSSLPVQVLRALEPDLAPLFRHERSEGSL